ncbi:hypothetical protein LIA77_07023 [Sarocladium implicatum]|nr:hypothetical protein LIA77_07023 [Sarocladium implicatum]
MTSSWPLAWLPAHKIVDAGSMLAAGAKLRGSASIVISSRIEFSRTAPGRLGHISPEKAVKAQKDVDAIFSTSSYRDVHAPGVVGNEATCKYRPDNARTSRDLGFLRGAPTRTIRPGPCMPISMASLAKFITTICPCPPNITMLLLDFFNLQEPNPQPSLFSPALVTFLTRSAARKIPWWPIEVSNTHHTPRVAYQYLPHAAEFFLITHMAPPIDKGGQLTRTSPSCTICQSLTESVLAAATTQASVCKSKLSRSGGR